MELREGADKISAVLSLPDEVGSLHEVLTIFAVYGLNLVKLESRPLPGRSWEYLFFLEFDGSLADPAMDGALQGAVPGIRGDAGPGKLQKQPVRRRGDGQGCAYHRSFLGHRAAVARRFAREGLACGGELPHLPWPGGGPGSRDRRRRGDRPPLLPGDVSDPAQAAALVRAAEEQLGPWTPWCATQGSPCPSSLLPTPRTSSGAR